MLVVTPEPHSHESLFGYLIRLSESNGYHTPTVVTSYAGYPRGGLITFSSDLQGISKVTGVEQSKLDAIGYVSQSDTSLMYYLRGVQVSHGRENWHLWRNQRAICPACIHDFGYIEAYWDLKFAVGCPRHGIEALQRCQTCGDKLSWKRQGLLTCHCGATLEPSTCQKVDTSTRHLLALIHRHLHGEKIQGLNEDYFPEQVKRLTLLELLHLVRTLGKFDVHSDQQDQETEATIDCHVKAAADALADWPHRLHQYLSRLGKYFQDKNGTHIGLRKQFSPFYNAVFKRKKFGETFEFIRTEFVRFGSESWGSAVIDKKLYRDASHEEIQRFVSVTEAARRLQVSPRTLKKWCTTGHIPCESVNMTQGKRYVIDSQYIAKFERKPGESMDARHAAAFLGIPVSVLKQLKSSAFYSSDHLPQIMSGFHQNDLLSFKDRLERASSSAPLITPQFKNQSTLDSVLKSSKWWLTDAKTNLLCAFIDGRIKPVGKATTEPLSVYFDKEQILEFTGTANGSDFSEALYPCQGAKLISCSSQCISEMIRQKIIATSQGTGCRIVCAHSLEQFDKRYIALNTIARNHSTSAHRLTRLAHEIQLNMLKIKVLPKGYTTSFIERNSSVVLLAALKKSEKRLPKKRVKVAEVRDIKAVRQYLYKLTQSNQPLPRNGNKLNKVALAQASGIDRNAIYNSAEIQRLLDEHSEKDIEQHDIKTGSRLDILEAYLRNLTDNVNDFPLKKNGKPCKRQIAKEAGISRSVFYSKEEEANQLLEKYLSAYI